MGSPHEPRIAFAVLPAMCWSRCTCRSKGPFLPLPSLEAVVFDQRAVRPC